MEKMHQKYTLILFLFMLFFTGISFAYGNDVTIEETQYVPGVLILKFTEQFSGKNHLIPDNQSGVVVTGITSVDNVCQQYNILSMERVFPALKYSTPDLSRYFRVHFDEVQNPDTVRAAFEQCVEIELVEKDNVNVRFNAVPSDQYFSSQWYLYNSEGGADIDVQEAWNFQTGSSDVVVAIVDSGVDYNHEDLKGNIWINLAEYYGAAGVDDDGNGYLDDIRGYSFFDDQNNPMDDYGHGTHIAGIIAARANNTKGIAGIAGGWNQTPGCKLMCLKTSIFDETGLKTSSEAIAQAIQYAVDKGADVINLSLSLPDQALIIDVMNYANSAGVLVVAAAGNGGRDVSLQNLLPTDYLLSRDEIIAVAATNDEDGAWNEGTETGSTNYGDTIDVSAPGDSIFSTWPTNFGSLDYTYRSGTSMAAPVVAGIAALLKSEQPDWNSGRIKRVIELTSDPIDDLNPVKYQGKLGYGRVNAFSALKQTILPEAPTNLVATAIDQSSIRLIWQDESDNELQYKVTRSLDGVNFTLIQALDKDETVYFDTDLSPNTQYFYKVKAVNFSGPAIAGPVSATTLANSPPAAPANLTAIEVQPKVIELNWDDVSNETGYRVEKKVLNGEWTLLGINNAGDTSINDLNVIGGMIYYYRVCAINDIGSSNWSAIVSVHTELGAPTNLSSTSSCYEIQLEWQYDQPETENVDGFFIERYTGIDFVVIDTVANDVRSFWDIDVPCGQTYYYRVKAFNSLGQSDYSNTESARTTACSYCPYGLTMKITPDKKEVESGDSVVYSYEITNKSEDIIYDCQITDKTFGKIAKDFSLEPGEKKTFFKNAVVGKTRTNFASVEGKDSKTKDSQKIKAHACSTVKVKKN